MLRDLYAIGGFAGAGKDALADALIATGKIAYIEKNVSGVWHKTFMAAPLEQAILAINPWIQTDPGQWLRYTYLHETVGYDASKKYPEVREMLQKIGTEFGRNQIDQNIWTNSMRSRILRMEEELAPKHLAIIVTGIRYPNELRMLRQFGCNALWVDRPGVEAVNAHSSELTLGPEDFDVVVKNDGSLGDLDVKAAMITSRTSPTTAKH